MPPTNKQQGIRVLSVFLSSPKSINVIALETTLPLRKSRSSNNNNNNNYYYYRPYYAILQCYTGMYTSIHQLIRH